MQLSRLLRATGVSILLAVLAAGPFFRGLFFWTELLAALAGIAAGFGLWLLGRRLGGLDPGLPGGLAGGALLALLACYLLQFAWPAYARGNLDWSLRVAAAGFAYIMMRAEAGPGLRRWLGWAFVLSAAGVGLVGFLEITGYLTKDAEMAKMLSLVGLQNRMFTTFQYPNTAAAYFLAAVLTAAGLGLDERRPWKLALAGGFMSFLTLAFFFTVSRGAVVVLPFGLLLFFLGLPRGSRWPALLLLLASFVGLAAVMQPVGAAAAAKAYPAAFRYLALGTGAGALAGLALHFYLKLSGRMQAALATGALLLVVAAFGVIRPTLPKQATRLLDMNFNTVNVVLRLMYDQDALRMATAQPLGRGGWGWDRGYRQYQAFNYTARETHNHYAQTAVEAGWPGLAALLAALAAGLWAAWKARNESPLGWSLAAGAGLIAAHSAIDFNLSFGAIWLLLWSLLGAAASPTAPLRRPQIAFAAGGLTAAIAAVLAGILTVGSLHVGRAWALSQQGDAEGAATAARQAARLDPLHPDPYELLGDRESLARAVALDPHNSGRRFKLAVAHQLNRDFDGALQEARAAMEAQPMVSVYWNKVAELEGLRLIDALHAGDTEAARQTAERLELLANSLTARKIVADPLQKLWGGGPKLAMDDVFKLRYGQALYLTGQRAAAVPLLQEAAKSGLLGSEAHVWLYAIYEQRGDKKAIAELESKPWIRFRAQNPVYKAISVWQ